MLRLSRLLVAVLVAAACAAGVAIADSNTGVVYVHVLDAKSGKAAAGWTVQVTARDGDSQAITGASGQVNFLTVTPGLARIDVLRRGELGACPAVIMISANEQTIVNVHVHRTSGHEMACSPRHAQTMVKPGVMSDVYDIY